MMNTPRLFSLEPLRERGGVARYLSALVEAGEGRLQVEVLVPFGWWKSFVLVWKQRRATSTWVVSHVWPVGVVCYVMSYVTSSSYTIILHGLDIMLARRSWWRAWLTYLILRRAKCVVANSSALAKEIEQWCHRSVGVLYPLVGRPSEQERERTSHPWVHLLTVARLVKRKNHETIIRALCLLKDDPLLPPWVYTIVGNGPLEAELRSLIDELGLVSRVRLVTDAHDEDLPRFYREADLFVMPTRADQIDREGFGMVYLEAGHYGIPSVATRVPGVDEAVVDGVTGWLVDPEDAENPKALAEAFSALLKDAPDRLRRGDRARAHAAHFSDPTPLKRFLDRL